ncbi:DoxX family protein [Streptomyces sp. NBC_01511]|uniref:DoxX family protein n=1 Tax=Streptomyces sp. NBC_01511 TaxID=2903889 RepID=UPI0038677BCD
MTVVNYPAGFATGSLACGGGGAQPCGPDRVLAAGLLAGFAGVLWLGFAAGVGLSLFSAGAVTAHPRAHVLYDIAFPGLYLLLAVAATAYFAGRT